MKDELKHNETSFTYFSVVLHLCTRKIVQLAQSLIAEKLCQGLTQLSLLL